ncbi:MAG: TonB-dependent receptor [Burkholderiaceae bacterium]|nr:TonB-dependent receptor [Burkholderiaceae bacterium]
MPPVQLHPLAQALALLAASGFLTQAQAQATIPTAAASAPASAASAPARSGPRQVPAATPAQLEKVEVSGTASDTEQRRSSTAAKIVISREEIERFGDSSVSEVLKRLPGVTTGGRPGRGGDVRMRGMGGGYTQLLVNGERMPPGFSLDNLPPDQLERIEVMRAPTAEYGARAVAGTINIVLKEALKKTLNEVRAGVGIEAGRVSPNASWTRNNKLGDKGAYTLTVSVNRNNRWDDADTRSRWYDLASGTQLLDQHETGYSLEQREGMNVNARLQIPLAEGESLTLMPFMILSRGSNEAGRTLVQTGTATEQPYASYSSAGDGTFKLLRGNAQWQKRLGAGTRLEARGGLGAGRFSSQGLRREFDSTGTLTRSVDDSIRNRENNWSLNAKVSHQLQSEHSLVGGLELESSSRLQGRTTLQNGLPILTEFGDDLSASSRRVAAYVQDEWNPSKQISAYAGLRWEGIKTSSDSASYQARNTSHVLTPLLHAVWKPDEKSRNQIRSSLTRSYKAASLQELIARPSISQRFPTGGNEIGSPDRAGNPNLKPELATGIELAYEHYLSKGGLLSANLFHRRISDLIRNVVSLEDVSWSAQKRWVSRPQNVGNARTQGLELEAKFRLDELMDDATPVQLRANLSVFDSKVDQVPGPDNRLEGQPKGTANFGADYKLRGLPLSLGASVNITPAYKLRLSDISSSSVGSKIVTDAFVLWFIDAGTQLRFSANNLAPHDYLTTSSLINDTQRQDNENANRSKINWGLRLEMKL